jgi:hypothetical protein
MNMSLLVALLWRLVAFVIRMTSTRLLHTQKARRLAVAGDRGR